MIFLIRWLIRRHRSRSSTSSEKASGAHSSHDGVLSLVLHQARYELLSFLRNKQARFFTVLLPLAFLVILVGLFGNHTVGSEHVKESTYYVPGLSAMAVISASFVNLVISITAQRESGVLKRRRATPVPAWVLIAGRALTAMVVSLATMSVLMLVGRFAYHADLPARTVPAVALTAIVGSITFCVLAYALSAVIGSADAAQPVVQATVLPLYFISGVFVPDVDLPSWLRHIAESFPVEHLVDALHHAYAPGAGGAGFAWSDLAVLAVWMVAGSVIALRRFRWMPVAATA